MPAAQTKQANIKLGQARIMYEQGFNAREIHEHLKIPQSTISSWINKKGWKRGNLAEITYEMEKKTSIELAAACGLTKERVFKKIIEFQDAKMIVDGKKIPDIRTQIEGNKQAIDVLGLKRENLDVDINNLNDYQSLVDRYRKAQGEK